MSSKPPFASSRSGVVAIEFALIVPVMFLLAIGVLDLSRAVILWQEVYNAAHTIPLSASVSAVQSNRSTQLSVPAAMQQMSSVYAEIPWLADGIVTGPRSVTLSSLTFQPIPGCALASGTNCYTAYVAWSLSYPGGNGGGVVDPNLGQWQVVTRPCLVPVTQIHPTASPPPTLFPYPLLTVVRTLDVSNPDPILVADVHVQYRPFLYGLVLGNVDFWASGYWSARSADATKAPTYQYTTLTPTGATGTCAGW